jgi:hypothetical protein
MTRKTLVLHAVTAIGGMGCALLGIAALRATPLPWPRPTPPAGYVADDAGHTVVFATSAEAAREGQREVRDARERFLTVFATRGSRLVVVLADDPAQFSRLDLAPLRRGGARLVPFLTRSSLDASSAESSISAGGDADGPVRTKLLAHEACHAYVAAVADQVSRRGRTTHGEYGHPALPDWFEEAAATLCENPEARRERLRHFRQHLDQRIPLRRFQSMPHPVGGPGILKRLGIEPTPGRAQVHHLTPERIRKAIPGSDYVLFYSQALSLGEFIADRGGSKGMQSLARSLGKGKSLDQALAQARRVAPALPGSVDALEAEWLSWVIHGGG